MKCQRIGESGQLIIVKTMLNSLPYIFIYPGKVTDGKSLISHEQMNEPKLDV